MRTAEDLQRKAWDEWSEYIDRYASGAGRTATGLEFGRDTCFTVAAALATGGVASGVGAGLVRRALIEAGMQTAGQVIGQGTTHEMARIEGVADDDSFTKILERAGIGAVSSLAGSLVGGKLAPKFAPWLQGRVTDGLATRLGAPKDLMDKIVVHVMLEDGSGVVAETMTQSALDWAVFSRKLELEALDWDDFENELARGSFDHLVANVAEDLVAHSSGHGHVVWDPGSSRWRDTLNGRYAPRPSYMHRGQVREAFMRHVHSH